MYTCDFYCSGTPYTFSGCSILAILGYFSSVVEASAVAACLHVVVGGMQEHALQNTFAPTIGFYVRL